MGPNYQKFNEAKELIELGGAFEVTKPGDLIKKANILLNNKEELSHAISVNKIYVINGCGATEVILKHVNELISSRI
jgi:3-deoxy-D-manno-octulosonic-acid transferase